MFLDKLQIMMIARPALLASAPSPHSASCVHSIHHHEHIVPERKWRSGHYDISHWFVTMMMMVDGRGDELGERDFDRQKGH